MSHNKSASLPHPGTYCPVSVFLKDLFKKCQEGKKDDNLTISSSVAGIKGELERLNGNAAKELSYEHLEAAELSLPDVAFRYAVVYKDGRPALFVYFQLFAVSARNFNLHNDKSFVKNILGLFLNLKKARALVLGNALRTETQSYCYDTTALSSAEAVEAVAVVAERLANTDDASAVILPGLDCCGAGTLLNLAGMGYVMPWEDNVMDMAIAPEWKTLEDYLASLTRKYKTRANKVLSNRQHLKCKELSISDLSRYQPEMARLFAAVIDKQSFVFTTSGVAYIAELKKLYKDGLEIRGYFKDDQLVAFCSAFVTERTYEPYYVGFDTELNSEYQLYFNLLLGSLQRAILLGKPVLKLGRTSLDAKASLGAKARTTQYLVKLRRIPDVALKWFTSYFASAEDGKWKLRNPMK